MFKGGSFNPVLELQVFHLDGFPGFKSVQSSAIVKNFISYPPFCFFIKRI